MNNMLNLQATNSDYFRMLPDLIRANDDLLGVKILEKFSNFLKNV